MAMTPAIQAQINALLDIPVDGDGVPIISMAEQAARRAQAQQLTDQANAAPTPAPPAPIADPIPVDANGVPTVTQAQQTQYSSYVALPAPAPIDPVSNAAVQMPGHPDWIWNPDSNMWQDPNTGSSSSFLDKLIGNIAKVGSAAGAGMVASNLIGLATGGFSSAGAAATPAVTAPAAVDTGITLGGSTSGVGLTAGSGTVGLTSGGGTGLTAGSTLGSAAATNTAASSLASSIGIIGSAAPTLAASPVAPVVPDPTPVVAAPTAPVAPAPIATPVVDTSIPTAGFSTGPIGSDVGAAYNPVGIGSGAPALSANGAAGALGMTKGVAANAVNAGVINAGVNLAAGGNTESALKAGLTGAALGAVGTVASDYVGGLLPAGTSPALTNALGTVAGGAAVGGASALINGKDIGQGILNGAGSGVINAAGNYVGGLVNDATGSSTLGGAASGGLIAGLNGKDILTGALVGGIDAGTGVPGIGGIINNVINPKSPILDIKTAGFSAPKTAVYAEGRFGDVLSAFKGGLGTLTKQGA